MTGLPLHRAPSHDRHLRKRLLADRDGDSCFFCERTPEEVGSLTEEHFLARSLGGPDILENLVLACEDCNQAAGAAPVAQKMRLRDSKREETLRRGYGDIAFPVLGLAMEIRSFITSRVRHPERLGYGPVTRTETYVSTVTASFLCEALRAEIDEPWTVDGGMPAGDRDDLAPGRGAGGFRESILEARKPHFWVVGWRSRLIVDLAADLHEPKRRYVVTTIDDPRYHGNLTPGAVARLVRSDRERMPSDLGDWMAQWTAKRQRRRAIQPLQGMEAGPQPVSFDYPRLTHSPV